MRTEPVGRKLCEMETLDARGSSYGPQMTQKEEEEMYACELERGGVRPLGVSRNNGALPRRSHAVRLASDLKYIVQRRERSLLVETLCLASLDGSVASLLQFSHSQPFTWRIFRGRPNQIL